MWHTEIVFGIIVLVTVPPGLSLMVCVALFDDVICLLCISDEFLTKQHSAPSSSEVLAFSRENPHSACDS